MKNVSSSINNFKNPAASRPILKRSNAMDAAEAKWMQSLYKNYVAPYILERRDALSPQEAKNMSKRYEYYATLEKKDIFTPPDLQRQQGSRHLLA